MIYFVRSISMDNRNSNLIQDPNDPKNRRQSSAKLNTNFNIVLTAIILVGVLAVLGAYYYFYASNPDSYAPVISPASPKINTAVGTQAVTSTTTTAPSNSGNNNPGLTNIANPSPANSTNIANPAPGNNTTDINNPSPGNNTTDINNPSPGKTTNINP
jgi:hypothetical protein